MERCPHRHSNAKRDSHSCDDLSSRRGRRVDDRWIRISWRAVDHCGVVAGNVNDLRFSLLNHDDSLVFDGLRLHFLLLGGFKVSSTLGLHAHALNRFHHVILLRQKGITQVGGPLDVFCKLFDHIGQRRHGLHAGIPVFFLESVHQRLVFQVLVLRQPLLKLDDFQRIGGRSENLGEQRIRIECDGCHQRIQLVIRNLRCGLLLRRILLGR